MGEVDDCYSTHLIEGDGTFNADGLDNFTKLIKLRECGDSYVVVSVMGQQSSGKSTLMNHLFCTNFIEMNAEMGRSQTTQGIWIAKCIGIEPCTIVMDIEGTDGQERGEDDTVFEKQSALFAMAVSDIVILNMWYSEIGLERAANKPLLKTVFQVMLRLFSPRKMTLMLVIRDVVKTPADILERKLMTHIQNIWDSVPKPEDHKGCDLSKFFNVEFVALSSYAYQEEEFKKDVASLRKKFIQSTSPGGLASDRQGVIPGSGFSVSARTAWEKIKENKDLKLPAIATMVATIRCEEIAKEKSTFFAANQDWLELEENAKSHLVPGFGKKLTSLLENCLSNYDEEVIHYVDVVRSEKRTQLHEALMRLVQPTCKLMFEHIQSEALDNFKTTLKSSLNEKHAEFAAVARDCLEKSMKRFDELCEDATSKQANWETTEIRDKLSHDLDSHITEVRATKLSELTTLHKSYFEEELCGPVEDLLKLCNDDMWLAIRSHLDSETKRIVKNFSDALSSFELHEKDMEDMISKMKDYGRGLVKEKVKDESKKVLERMKERFRFTFNHRDDSTTRASWTENDDIPCITKTARMYSLKLLSLLAVIRLDEDQTDTIWDTLVHSLLEPRANASTSRDPLASKTWDQVQAPNTLITPIQCKVLWNKFESETEYIITHATISQEAHKRETNLIQELKDIKEKADKREVDLYQMVDDLMKEARKRETDVHQMLKDLQEKAAHHKIDLSPMVDAFKEEAHKRETNFNQMLKDLQEKAAQRETILIQELKDFKEKADKREINLSKMVDALKEEAHKRDIDFNQMLMVLQEKAAKREVDLSGMISDMKEQAAQREVYLSGMISDMKEKAAQREAELSEKINDVKEEARRREIKQHEKEMENDARHSREVLHATLLGPLSLLIRIIFGP